MTDTKIKEIVKLQRNFFETGTTLNPEFRLKALKRLRNFIYKYEDELNAALKEDLNKCEFESYMCETGLVLSEITYMEKNLIKFSKDKKVLTPLSQFHSVSYRKPSPYGVVLVMSPWNYPVLLTLEPLVDAIAAGNTVILKPSAYSSRSGEVLQRLIKECFNEKYVAVITGGRKENEALLEEHFDYIFFTGSKSVGKLVMSKAAAHLTPVTLELGGKSPCIVDETADIKLAAKRIVFGKFVNCGQTCVAPDFVYCHRNIKEKLVKEIRKQIVKQYTNKPLKNEDYGKIINEKHFERVSGLIDYSKVVHGGEIDNNSLKIEPTVMDNVTFSDRVMEDEIFGPVLPVIVFDTIDEVIRNINTMEHPLALYVFTEDNSVADKVMANIGFGGGCINDTLIHIATSEMPFGGFGESGMGCYHGKSGFDTFTHYKSIVDKKTWIDLPVRYQPYKDIYKNLLRKLLK